MALRVFVTVGVVGLIAGLAGCAEPTPPPRVVATVPEPPPEMPVGGYPELDIPGQRADGTYVTPNFAMTDAAAVWHLRSALNVAALGCDKAGGGVVDGYNRWLQTHVAGLDKYNKQYLHEWEIAGWRDWADAYDNNQTRIYNFYSQSTIRVAFCAAARAEVVNISSVADADLPTYSRGALVRLDQPFIDFYTAFDKWRDYYAPKVAAPKFVATTSAPPPPPPPAPPPAPVPAAPVAVAPAPGVPAVSAPVAPAPSAPATPVPSN